MDASQQIFARGSIRESWGGESPHPAVVLESGFPGTRGRGWIHTSADTMQRNFLFLACLKMRSRPRRGE
eukprot:4123075-Pyramimonas_sp.AAC.1